MKKRTHITRKNIIAFVLIFIYAFFVIVTALALDATNPLFAKKNVIQKTGLGLNFPSIEGSFGSYALLLCVDIYLVLFTAAFIFESRTAKFYEGKKWTKKWILIYAATFLVSGALAFGIGTIAQYPYDLELMGNSYLFMVESFLVALIYYFLVIGTIGSCVALYVNFKNIDKPFRFFNPVESMEDFAREEAAIAKEDETRDEQGRLAETFGDKRPGASSAGGVASSGGMAPSGASAGAEGGSPLKEKERVFPGLCTIDLVEGSFRDGPFEEVESLKDVAERFRNYLAKEESLYFDLGTIRAFMAGLSASRFIILEGLSGTGKSSLARYFSEFLGESSYFEAVQATWRDRTSILGFYNDFSKSYNETEFLKRLYQYGYRPNHVNVMVLDEMNISRIEYYFADFLSVLEYPRDKWKIKLMQFPYDFEPPLHLEDGILSIPENTWFIGTANKDDSTYTITDKVYDRAIAISFDSRNEPFTPDGPAERMALSYQGLEGLFEKARQNPLNSLTKEDYGRFSLLIDFVSDTFNLTFGNRILHQMELFVPCYVAAGGTKEEALDFLFCRKLIYKLNGRFEDYVRQGLIDLRSLIEKTYGPESFVLSKKEIDKLLRRI